MKYIHIFLFLLILSFSLSSCWMELPPQKEYPYKIIYDGNSFKEEFDYIDSLNRVKLNLRAYYIPDSSAYMKTHIMLDVKNMNEREIVLDSNSVVVQYDHQMAHLLFIEPNRVLLEKGEKGSLDYFFKSGKITSQTPNVEEKELITLKVNALINDNRIIIVKGIYLQKE